jgi:phosphoserine phosphatase RsbU/P
MDTTSRKLILNITDERWQKELEKSSVRYHIVACYLAIIFDPLFGVTDYYNIPNGWQQILIIRFSVSLISAIPLLLRKRFAIPSFVIVFIPFLLISLQNAYTFSLVAIDNFTGHTLNYMALLIGAAMFVLWKWYYSVFMVIVSIAATAFFIGINQTFTIQQALVNGGLLLVVVALFMILLIQTRYSLTVKELKARLALAETNEALALQKEMTEEKNKDITDSIRYARRIQESILPSTSQMKAALNCFVLYRPKDIVSGDFYWFATKDNLQIVAAVDCTGHGVPGAFMSVLGNSLLSQIINENDIVNPSEILLQLNKSVRNVLQQGSNSQSQDGMDMGLCVIDKNTNTLCYAGAKRPLYIIKNEELSELKVNKNSIGGRIEVEAFESVILQMQKNDLIYLSTDGYADQFGGSEKRKYMSKNFKKLLLSIHQLALESQEQALHTEFEQWKGEEKQTDDILVIGIKF